MKRSGRSRCRLASTGLSLVATAALASTALAAPPETDDPAASPDTTLELEAAPTENLAPPTMLDLDPDDLGTPEPEPVQTAAAPEPVAASRFTLHWSGAVDFGFFAPRGTGVGWIQDEGPNHAFPAEALRYAWVFLGDIYSTAVNSRGEPADLGNAPGPARTDSIDSNGAAGFVLNEVNLTGTAGFGDGLVGTLSANLVPRSGANFSRGDGLEVDLAQVEWQPTTSQKSVFDNTKRLGSHPTLPPLN